MPSLNEDRWGNSGPQGRGRKGLFARVLSSAGRAFEAESERWFLWLPVVFAAGILTYFALPSEPDVRIAGALVLASIGLVIMVRHAPLGLVLGGACLVSRDFPSAPKPSHSGAARGLGPADADNQDR